MAVFLFGVGPGVVIVVLVWICSIILCIICIRTRKIALAVIILVAEFFITLIIIFWPFTGSTAISTEKEIPVDYIGIPRCILAIAQAIILIMFCIEFIKNDLIAPIVATTVVFD